MADTRASDELLARERLGRGRVGSIQRARMLAAAASTASEQGAASVTVTSVVERAGVSRRTFYEIFDNSEACLLATIEAGANAARLPILAASHAGGSWRERTRAALAALLAFFDERPQIARLLVVEWLAAGPKALAMRQEVVQELAVAIQEGAKATGGRPAPPPLTGEAIVGAVASIVHARLLERQGGSLVDLTSPLMGMIVLPYLGQAEARRELERSTPVTTREDAGRQLDGAPERPGLRITHRTVLVLGAVAAHPGSSNRLIAQAADVSDQGQISKLMRRLQRAGLVENVGAAASGAANAWHLTPKGKRIHESLRL